MVGSYTNELFLRPSGPAAGASDATVSVFDPVFVRFLFDFGSFLVVCRLVKTFLIFTCVLFPCAYLSHAPLTKMALLPLVSTPD